VGACKVKIKSSFGNIVLGQLSSEEKLKKIKRWTTRKMVGRPRQCGINKL
jgi:hypothetical protein